jgi:tetratricopeptide (TPR) repeat protein
MQKILMILAFIGLISGISCSSKLAPTETLNKQVTDSRGNKNLIGHCTEKSLQKKPYSLWFNKNYADYRIDTFAAEKLKPNLRGKHFCIFMGTWCGDSKREVPRIFKLLEYCGVHNSQIELVMLSNQDSVYKQSPEHEERGLNIHRVPDLLVYDGRHEMGRIVESPVISLEKDLLSITNKEPYSPNYRAVSFLIELFGRKTIGEIESHLGDYKRPLDSLVKNASELNTYGYVLMASKEMARAGIVFKANILLFPGVANVFDSMGDYCLKTGDKAKAREYYQKTLVIEPTNEDAKKMLDQLAN